MTALGLPGCAERRHVMDCWVMPEPERAAAMKEGRCGDAFGRYYKPLPEIVTDMATGVGGRSAGGAASGHSGGEDDGGTGGDDRRRRR
jgi:hypothetical protein